MGAALLVLLGLGLFAAGLLTGVTAWYWACVGACAAAAVLIVLARRSMSHAPARAPAAAAGTSGPVAAAAPGASPSDGAARAAGNGAAASAASAVGAPLRHHQPDDPPVEEVEVTDLLLIVDLTDEVLVVDEHPRYHVTDCRWLQGRGTIPLPLDEARTDGFTPCGVCRPDRTLAARTRARRPGN